jgi:hypothetical protein
MFEGLKGTARRIASRLDERVGAVVPDNGVLHNLDDVGRTRAAEWQSSVLASVALSEQMDAFSPGGSGEVLTTSAQMGYPDA